MSPLNIIACIQLYVNHTAGVSKLSPRITQRRRLCEWYGTQLEELHEALIHTVQGNQSRVSCTAWHFIPVCYTKVSVPHPYNLLPTTYNLRTMSDYYTAQRTKNLYEPNSTVPFKLSRSKIDLSLECPRCFYLDRRLGVGRPPGFPFNLNSAVDTLLKKEFDAHRIAGTKHPLQEHYGIDCTPAAHDELDTWRHNFTGVQFFHTPTNFAVFGAIDDLWINGAGEYVVVDYKATAKAGKIDALDAPWHIGYKRQMEIYQWLLRHKGYTVSTTGYFVYCNGQADKEAFDARLEFDVTVIPYTGNDAWVEGVLMDAKKILDADATPKAAPTCDFCSYAHARAQVEKSSMHQ